MPPSIRFQFVAAWTATAFPGIYTPTQLTARVFNYDLRKVRLAPNLPERIYCVSCRVSVYMSLCQLYVVMSAICSYVSYMYLCQLYVVMSAICSYVSYM
jgi:hypothetical protein